MLNRPIVVACKEITDSLRDVRSVISSLTYALMGPLIVGLVSLGDYGTATAAGAGVLIGMMSVFTLVAAFVGGMNVAMDTIAGERERHSLLPLLLNPVNRLDLLVGKWLAVCLFATAGLAIDLAGFAIVLGGSGLHLAGNWPRLFLVLALAMVPLPLLAASLQLLISTVCRAVKEAQTYLSLIVFLPMSLGMFLVFFPAAARGWCSLVPLAGQQLQLQLLMQGREISLLQPLALGCLTTVLAFLILLAAANRLQRDEIIYGS
jgi:sodium transport system permease protein